MGIPESRKKKLQMLLRSVSRGDIAGAKDILREAEGGQRPRGAAKPRAAVPLDQACPGSEQAVTLGGREFKYWTVRRTLDKFAPDMLEVAREYSTIMRGGRQNFDELEASVALCHVANMGPQDLLFMDAETCGWAGSAIFLIGTMSFEGGQFVFEQHFARSYAEEAAILQSFAERYARIGALVTFNGKSFDMTMIRDRCAYHGVGLPDPPPPHLDLLHESRKRWRRQVPNCRLQTLERFICGRTRIGDIPGAEIPDAYHNFVRTADASRIKQIMHHNLLDLLTLAQLLCAILSGCDPLPQ